MFKKTREKIYTEYVKPAQNAIAFAVVMSILAFIGSVLAIAIASGGAVANAV